MATSIFDLIKGDIDDYSQSISGMIAFCKSISKSDECDGYCFFIGRRMETSEDNHVTKKTEVIPDLVVQVKKHKKNRLGLACFPWLVVRILCRIRAQSSNC